MKQKGKSSTHPKYRNPKNKCPTDPGPGGKGYGGGGEQIMSLNTACRRDASQSN